MNLRFEPFELDVAAAELRKAGRPVRLQPQPARILALLAANAGRLVTREEIRAQIWSGDTFVDFEQGLNYCIAQIRTALGDDPKSPKYVETLQRRGYRFVANVERLAVVQAATEGKVVIAVLPFENLSGDADQDYFSDGLTDEMITELGQLNPERLAVIARTSAMTYKSTRKTVQEIGRELGVGYILEGSVRRANARVRVTAKLIHVADQTQVWGERYDRDLGDILQLQGDLAAAIAHAVQLQLTPRTRQRLDRARPVNPEAYENYLKGRFLWNQRTQRSLEQAIVHLERAIAIDPDFALAFSALGDCHVVLGSHLWIPPRQAASSANAACERALRLDASLAEPHAALGFVRSQYEYRWAEAEEEFRCALDLNANYATAHHWYAFYLAAVARLGEAIDHIRVSERLDPLSPIIRTNVGTVLFWARDFDAAVEQYRDVLRQEPNFWVAHWMLGLAYEQQGHFVAAADEHRKAIERSGAAPTGLIASLARAQALLGARADAERLLAELLTQPCRSLFHMAAAHVALGDYDSAFECLNDGREQGESWMAFLNVDARMDALRDDPRFGELLESMRFP